MISSLTQRYENLKQTPTVFPKQKQRTEHGTNEDVILYSQMENSTVCSLYDFPACSRIQLYTMSILNYVPFTEQDLLELDQVSLAYYLQVRLLCPYLLQKPRASNVTLSNVKPKSENEIFLLGKSGIVIPASNIDSQSESYNFSYLNIPIQTWLFWYGQYPPAITFNEYVVLENIPENILDRALRTLGITNVESLYLEHKLFILSRNHVFPEVETSIEQLECTMESCDLSKWNQKEDNTLDQSNPEQSNPEQSNDKTKDDNLNFHFTQNEWLNDLSITSHKYQNEPFDNPLFFNSDFKM